MAKFETILSAATWIALNAIVFALASEPLSGLTFA